MVFAVLQVAEAEGHDPCQTSAQLGNGARSGADTEPQEHERGVFNAGTRGFEKRNVLVSLSGSVEKETQRWDLAGASSSGECVYPGSFSSAVGEYMSGSS